MERYQRFREKSDYILGILLVLSIYFHLYLSTAQTFCGYCEPVDTDCLEENRMFVLYSEHCQTNKPRPRFTVYTVICG